MAVAGKVAITLSTENGGAWSADVTYDRLVAVKHNNNLYISRKTVANVEPPNEEFWFLALEGFSGDDIEDIIDGTTQVGNAKTLDGHEAEYFFPKSGGIIDGNISLIRGGNVAVQHRLKNDLRIVELLIDQSGVVKLHDYTNGQTIVNSTADGTNTFDGHASEDLPLTGGKIGNNTHNPLDLENLSSDEIKIRFSGKSGNLGYLGMTGKGKLVVTSSVDWVDRDILHTGNKPTGTYTGNGDATQRTVSIGGVGETLRIVNSALGIAFVTNDGAHCITKDGFLIISPSECKFTNGTLTMETTASVVNANGYGFSYDLL